ncbi:MAG: hypothetical protein ABL982_15385 [Vicinamibacterales bacterium]
MVERLLRDARYAVDSLLLNPVSLEALGPALETRPDVTIFECQTGDFEAITGFNVHRWNRRRWPDQRRGVGC